MLHTVIMAGGSGTRFWPESLRAHPKQFLQLSGERTLIQATWDRCADLSPPAGYWVVTNDAYTAETIRQLPDVPEEQILREPCGRNTAPCIGLAALHLLAVDHDPIMLIVPADHVISSKSDFEAAVSAAQQLVKTEPQSLVLFGVQPNYPATGFGYIQRGAEMPDAKLPAYRVDKFREKPDRSTAEKYLSEGGYYWNCGIFVWRARAILDALHAYNPQISMLLRKLQAVIGKVDYQQVLSEVFAEMPAISIDYAVLEHSADVCVLEAPFAWDDVGSWQALARGVPPDTQGNAVMGPSCNVQTTDSIIRTTPEHLVATYGVHDLIIVHTPRATLVADRHDENALRHLLAELERQGFPEYL